MPESAKMTEEQIVSLVRNALIVAGQEMGNDGDHWPVIKSTIHNIMKDWEDLKTERNVSLEVKKHYDKMLADLEDLASQTTDKVKSDIEEAISQIRVLTDACFAKVDENNLYFGEDEIPIHAKRAQAIIKSLGGEDGN